MFSPATRKSGQAGAVKRRSDSPAVPNSSPATPAPDGQKSIFEGSVPNRPKAGTPAPWISRLSVLARISSRKRDEKIDDINRIQPIYIGEFPQVVREEQANFIRKSLPGKVNIAGGMDKETALAWLVCGSRLFVWSYLSPAPRKCVALDIPSDVSRTSGAKQYPDSGTKWLFCGINWNNVNGKNTCVRRELKSAGIVLCNQRTQAIVYWPDIYLDKGSAPVTYLASSEELRIMSSPLHNSSPPSSRHYSMRSESDMAEPCFNSLIASAIHGNQYACVVLASTSNGQLWLLICNAAGIHRKKVYGNILASYTLVSGGQPTGNTGYPRSLLWRFPSFSREESSRQLYMLTEHEIHCFIVDLSSTFDISKLWSHEIIGTDDEYGIKKDLASEKRIWPLDAQVDDYGQEIIILVATFCKDRVSSSSYMQYSLLTMQYNYGMDLVEPVNLVHKRNLKKKALQVIIPKARVEEEDTLFSMKLRIEGMLTRSYVILAGDGTATVFHCSRYSTRPYQFDLPYDAGKVLDASVLPSGNNIGEEGTWAVLTEKAGVWAIPEKAVLLGVVERPDRCLSRKGSSKEGFGADDQKNLLKVGNVDTAETKSQSWDCLDRDKANFVANMQQTAQDEEVEGLVNHLFHDFLHSGRVEDSLEKLQNSRAFERDGIVNAFVRLSKSLVDTLAKHWTTTRGAEIVSLSVVSTQLMEKQQKHQKLLEFLALSLCHEELCLKQRHAMHLIMEHGEKLAAMIQLRELQNMVSQSRLNVDGSQNFGSEREVGSLWDFIQIVGERARRNTVLLMDRDNTEVFFSKVSDLEEVFYCIERHLESIVSVEQPIKIQIPRLCELANACATLVRSAIHYKNEHQMWYPSPEGLMPWYCQHVVRNGMWVLANCMVQILNDYEIDLSAKSDICSHLEVLANIMLEAYLGAITVKVELEEEHKGLAEEYWNRRDILLGSLYQQIKVLVEVQCQDLVEEAQEEKNKILRKLSENLLSIARRHEGYSTLWNICYDLNDATLLKSFMRESMGPKGGFGYFVFEQLYKERHFSELLRLGEEFPEKLATFLKDHPDLLWLHEIFLHQFSSASKTLHVLALSEDRSLKAATEEETVPGFGEAELMLPDRKRLLHLSKIAAVAGGDANCRADVERIDADLRILSSQEEILKILSDGEEKRKIGCQLLSPGDLIRLCLRAPTPELLMKAFDIFAWTSSSFRTHNTTLLEECWKITIDLDDWDKLHQFSVAEGWSDVDTLRVLEKTVLFQASQRCYGPESESFEGGFDEVLPLRLENMEPSDLMGRATSVEMILMQHKDFPDAGKLMLTALMLGSARAEIDAEDGIAPME